MLAGIEGGGHHKLTKQMGRETKERIPVVPGLGSVHL